MIVSSTRLIGSTLRVRGWRIWYGDGSVFDSKMGSWEAAPSENVQILIVYYRPPYRDVFCGRDDYVLRNHKGVKRGKLMLPDSAFETLRLKAFVDEWRP